MQHSLLLPPPGPPAGSGDGLGAKAPRWMEKAALLKLRRAGQAAAMHSPVNSAAVSAPLSSDSAAGAEVKALVQPGCSESFTDGPRTRAIHGPGATLSPADADAIESVGGVPAASSRETPIPSPDPSGSSPAPPSSSGLSTSLPDRADREAFIAHLDALIRSGDPIETANGPLPIGHPDDHEPLAGEDLERMLNHERDLLAAVLTSKEDHSGRWGSFRRLIGLRFDEPVPPRLWNHRRHRLIAEEIDAIFRGERDGHTINAEAIRHGLRERALAGRWLGDLMEMEEALAFLLDWGKAASALDFPIACDFFQAAKARQLFYPALRRLLAREHKDVAIATELQECRRAISGPEERPRPISTGIPSLDVDMRGGILPGQPAAAGTGAS